MLARSANDRGLVAHAQRNPLPHAHHRPSHDDITTRSAAASRSAKRRRSGGHASEFFGGAVGLVFVFLSAFWRSRSCDAEKGTSTAKRWPKTENYGKEALFHPKPSATVRPLIPTIEFVPKPGAPESWNSANYAPRASLIAPTIRRDGGSSERPRAYQNQLQTPFRRASSLARELESTDARFNEQRVAPKRTSSSSELVADAQVCTSQPRPCGPSMAQWRGHAILSPEAGDNRGKGGGNLLKKQKAGPFGTAALQGRGDRGREKRGPPQR